LVVVDGRGFFRLSQVMTTLATETITRKIFRATLWANKQKLFPALTAKLPRVRILSLALCAFHFLYPPSDLVKFRTGRIEQLQLELAGLWNFDFLSASACERYSQYHPGTDFIKEKKTQKPPSGQDNPLEAKFP
jgi:hypothetical protein